MNTAETVPILVGIGSTPLGPVHVLADRGRVVHVWLGEPPDADRLAGGPGVCRDDSAFASVVDRVNAAIEGRPFAADDGMPIDPDGTPFQRRVWEALRRIPRGTTTSYGAIAEALGRGRGSARAVATACAANPIAVLIPCHRVVPSGGGLGGYRWGVDRKRELLRREGALLL